MPTTRAATGNSKPRVIQQIEAAVAPKKRTTANTSKPRAKKVAAGRVEKKSATTTAKPKKTVAVKKSPAKKVVDKVAGKVKKAEGTVEGKPAKKVCFFPIREGVECVLLLLLGGTRMVLHLPLPYTARCIHAIEISV